ncbi:DUF5995 family protein [Nocardia inohanensis]|uniref:DUF5995 family protein n=1 Tax=Nocardia inohanensis TaxID=209246 RepID=UPI00082B3A99|nr:DUF5995 family protein [Nocardia inohanensis]
MWKSARIGLLVALTAAAALVSVPAAGAQPVAATVPDTFCGTPLATGELETIARLSDTTDLSGDALARLETAVARNHEITEILIAHRDRRGLFGIGLDGVEQAAVMPLQRDPAAFQDREYAHAISLELLSRYLDNVHAAFTGGAVQPHWARYLELAGDCTVSGAQAAMAGYNAHLVVDLAYSVAAVHTKPENAPDYFKIVAAIAGAGDVIVDRTNLVYQADLGPLWRFYFLGEGLDLLVGRGVATKPLLVAADLGANVVIFGNGLALQDPALHDVTAGEIQALYGALDVAFQVLAAVHAL